MNRILISAVVISGVVLSASTNFLNSNSHIKEEKMETSKKQKVVALLKALETGETEPIKVINPNKYIQHNIQIEDGLEGFAAFTKILPNGETKVNTIRAFTDGEYVFTHSEYNVFGPKIGFDIFRFEDGKIVEHWDNLQEIQQPNPSGRTMIDGVTELKDLGKTEENKTLVSNFVDDILVNGKMDKLNGYFYGDNYIQHNPYIGDGLSGLGKALGEWAEQGITMKYDMVHQVLGEGNYVLVVSEGQLGGKHTAFYDLFRVEKGKIAEHWDVLETIPAKDKWKNNNSKF
ncbi:nuclear transport factor 2 family protein [Anditalea andensis]|nr:nuclear transport factor 2 family protein [Anditalea andensis]